MTNITRDYSLQSEEYYNMNEESQHLEANSATDTDSTPVQKNVNEFLQHPICYSRMNTQRVKKHCYNEHYQGPLT